MSSVPSESVSFTVAPASKSRLEPASPHLSRILAMSMVASIVTRVSVAVKSGSVCIFVGTDPSKVLDQGAC